jgi:hypothetical protein
VVVHHVEDHGEAVPMRAIDERAEVVRRSVQTRWRVREHAVIAPAKAPRELGDRHHFDDRHTDARERLEPLAGRAPRSFRRERADVHLVHDLSVAPYRRRRGCPAEAAWIDHHRRAEWTVRLKARRGIGEPLAIEPVPVTIPDGDVRGEDRTIPVRFTIELDDTLGPRPLDDQTYVARGRRPHAKVRAAWPYFGPDGIVAGGRCAHRFADVSSTAYKLQG